MLPTPRGSAAPGRELLRPVLRYPLAVVPRRTDEHLRRPPHMSAGGLAKKLDMDDSEAIAPVTPGLTDEQRVAASVLATQTPPHDRLSHGTSLLAGRSLCGRRDSRSYGK